jgi:hypothetical protein
MPLLRGFKKLLFREQNRAARLATERLGLPPDRPRGFCRKKKIEVSCGLRVYEVGATDLSPAASCATLAEDCFAPGMGQCGIPCDRCSYQKDVSRRLVITRVQFERDQRLAAPFPRPGAFMPFGNFDFKRLFRAFEVKSEARAAFQTQRAARTSCL